MSVAAVRGVVRQLGPSADPPSDAELLTAFAAKKDADAFAALVTRHGPNVFGVCRRILGDSHNAEDAFQAVFLVLAQKANCVSPPGSVGGWLYGVAVRTANKAKVTATRRRRREMIAATQAIREGEIPTSAERAELCSMLDQELAKLPETLRAAIILCDLHGKTRSEAAAELRCPEGTIAARLHRGRKKLADALSRRGLAFPVAGIAAILTPTVVPARVVQSVLAGVLSSSLSPAVQILAREVIRAMTATKNTVALGIITLVVGAFFAAASTMWSAEPVASSPLPFPTTETVPEQPAQKKLDQGFGYVRNVQFSPDGKQYVVVAGGTVTALDTNSQRIIWNTAGEAARYQPKSKSQIVMGSKEVSLHDSDTGKTTKRFPRPKTNWGWNLVEFSPDGKRYAAHLGFSIRIYDTETGFEPIRLDNQHEPGGGSALAGSTGRGLCFSLDSKKLSAVGVLISDAQIGAAEWDLESGARIETHKGNLEDGPYCSAFGPDGVSFAIGYRDSIELRANQKDPIRKLPVIGRATTIAFSPDGKLIAVGVRGDARNQADKEPGASDKPLGKIIKRSSENVVEIDIGSDAQVRPGLTFTVLPSDYPEKGPQSRMRVQLLEVATGKEVRRYDGFEGNAPTTELGITALTFSPDGKTLLAGTGILPGELEAGLKAKTGQVKLWNLDDKPKPPPVWREVGKLEGIDDYVDSIAFSPDGKSFVVGGLGGSEKNAVTMWNAATRKLLWDGGPTARGIAAVSFSPDGKLVAATNDKVTDFFEAQTGKLVELKKPFPGGKAVSFSPDGKWVAYSDSHTTGFRALDENYGSGSITTGTEIEQLKEKLPASLTWSPDSLYIAFSMPTTPDGDWRVGMMGVTAETKPKNLAGHKGKVTAVAWSRDGKYLASGGELGAVIIWEAKTFKKLREMNYGGGDGWSKINALAFSHDSKTLAIALELAEAKNAQRVILLDPETGERRQNDLQFFWNAPPMTVAFSPDGKTMLVGCGYKDETRRKLPPDERKKLGEVRIFTTEPEQPKANPGVDVPPAPMAVVPKWREKATLKDTDDLVFSVAFDPKGKTFAAGGLNGKITLWNAGNLHLMFGYESSPIFPFAKAITYSPDGSYVAENFKGGSRVIPAELIKLLRTEILPEDEGIKIMKGQEVPLALAFGPTEEVQGKKLNRLAMTDGQSVIATIWIDGGPPSTAKFGPLADAPKIEGVLPAGVAYSPDGKQLVFIPNNRMPNEKPETNRIALVWGGGSGAPMVFLKHGPAMVTAVAWSRDNSFIATGDASGDVVLWETKTFKQVRRMKIGGRGGNSYIHSLAFTTNGKTLAVGCTLDEGRNINRVAFFDTSTGNQVSDLQQFNSATLSLAFSPDDKTLIVGCGYRDAEARKMTAEERKKAGEVRVFTAEP